MTETVYARCDTDCKIGYTKTPGVDTGTLSGDDLLNAKKYTANPTGKTPCASTATDKCKCFVVAAHHTIDAKGADTVDETLYPGSSSKGNNSDLLDGKTVKDKYPEKKANPNDYWEVIAACIKLDDKGQPMVALSVQIHLPKGQQLASHSELIKKFGKTNVKTLNLPSGLKLKKG